jgi:23S rRNA A2030 N6-methylase RlmJ
VIGRKLYAILGAPYRERSNYRMVVRAKRFNRDHKRFNKSSTTLWMPALD